MSFIDPETIVKEFGLREGMKVVDVGVGTGAYVYALAHKVGPHGTVYAVEVQKGLLNKLEAGLAEKHIKNVDTVWADIDSNEGTHLASELADVVVLSNILFQIEHKTLCAKECVRILKQGGKVVIIDWSGSFSHMGPHPDAVVSKSDAIALFEKMGCEKDHELSNVGLHHWGVVMKKK